MLSFSTRTTIQAPVDVIWGLLTDAPGYPSWNHTVTGVDGTIALGEKITVHAKISPDRSFPVKVAVLEPGQKMVWSSGMPLGLFKGERTFTLTPKGEGVEFAMEEVFSGLLSGLIGRSIPDLTPAFEEFAANLKERAEQG
ncbi:MAG: SRPBCC domain-containing protein [Alphaproteobacteria bacterium]|nr:SRPBCC domain-containing protein [Alphaproteobacteria bacterium]